MSDIVEADRLFRSAPGNDIARFADAEGMAERIREWLETPEGTVAHYPSWGHNLTPFKHDPLSEGCGIEILIEMAIARKLPLDIDDIHLMGVNVTILDVDMFALEILHQFGQEREEVQL